MKSLQSYLEGIRADPFKGWRAAYADIMGQPLSDSHRLLKGVELFGEEVIFEAMIITSSRKLSSPDQLAYVLTVAKNLWKEELSSELEKSKDEIRLERAKRRISEGNAELAERIEQARQRVNADDSL